MKFITLSIFGALLCLLTGVGAPQAAAENIRLLETDHHLRGESLGAASEQVINRGLLSGYGVFKAERLINQSKMHLKDGASTFYSQLENRGQVDISFAPVTFHSDVVNHGRMKITDTTVRFNGSFTDHGAYVSDPSDNYFMDLVVGTSGYLVGGEGDRFFISNDFISASTSNIDWQTADCYLEFKTGSDTQHRFDITGEDQGADLAGYTDNFAWKTLNLAAGNSIELVDGNAASGGALYVKGITGAQISGTAVTNISGTDGINIYYLPEELANAYLDGQTYTLGSSGHLIPIGSVEAVPAMTPLGLALTAFLLIMVGIRILAQGGIRKGCG